MFPVPFNFGWMDLDLSTPPRAVALLGSQPPVDPMAQQAFVVAVFTSNGHFAVTADAFRLDSACAAAHLTFGP